MPDIKLYSTRNCPFCVRAKALLTSKDLEYTEIHVDTDAERLHEMIERSGNRTVPQIFINDKSIGGFDELSQFNAEGKLATPNNITL